MKKYLCLLSFFLLITRGVLAQVPVPVVDLPAIALMAANHEAQNENLKAIKSNEIEILAWQKVITSKMEAIRGLEEKMYNSLKTVESIISQAKDVKYAYEIIGDISDYQGEMVDIARGDNELLLVALKTEAALLDRTKNLLLYVTGVALLGNTDVNLMNNADRLNIIRHVVDELRVMRGLAYSVTRRMRAAKYGGLWQTMNPFQQIWPSYNSRMAVVNSLLEEHRNLRNR